MRWRTRTTRESSCRSSQSRSGTGRLFSWRSSRGSAACTRCPLRPLPAHRRRQRRSNRLAAEGLARETSASSSSPSRSTRRRSTSDRRRCGSRTHRSPRLVFSSGEKSRKANPRQMCRRHPARALPPRRLRSLVVKSKHTSQGSTTCVGGGRQGPQGRDRTPWGSGP